MNIFLKLKLRLCDIEIFFSFLCPVFLTNELKSVNIDKLFKISTALQIEVMTLQ
jgi:hypothetical protein